MGRPLYNMYNTTIQTYTRIKCQKYNDTKKKKKMTVYEMFICGFRFRLDQLVKWAELFSASILFWSSM